MDYEKARAARIALGADQYGKPMLFWAEGAAKFGYVPGEGSCGASLSEMADIAADLGMVHGVNLDGGGSSTMLVKKSNSNEFEVRNIPADLYRPYDRLIRDLYDSILVVAK